LIERSNKQWLNDLKKGSPEFNFALKDLRILITRGLKSGFSKWKKLTKEDIEDIVEECLIKILKNMGTYKGNSRFITWGCKIAINTALNELRHKRWGNVSLDELVEKNDTSFSSQSNLTSTYNPENRTIRKFLMSTINKLMQTRLSARQKKAMLAVRFYGMPLEEVARQMGTNRNSLYKLLHDARLKLKEGMNEEGLTKNELFESFMN